ncbi:hypothetical protein P12x_003759 [Tundrisphaera lichenicola]|uniref:hypothetical protein n=1 Tax=Tundrisphaera lichenicola TaxID=2029860 RepID=UPI003EC0C0AB
MDKILGPSTIDSDQQKVNRAVRAALVIYLSPILLLVLAIGAVGLMAGRLMNLGSKSTASPATITHIKHCHLTQLDRTGKVKSSV